MVRLKPGGVERHKEIQNFQRPSCSTHWYNLRAQQMGNVKVESKPLQLHLDIRWQWTDGRIDCNGWLIYRWQWIMKKAGTSRKCLLRQISTGQVAHLKPFAQGKNSSSQRLQLLWMDGLWSLIGWKIRLLIKVSWKHRLGCLFCPRDDRQIRSDSFNSRSNSRSPSTFRFGQASGGEGTQAMGISRFTWFLGELSWIIEQYWTGQPWSQWRNLLVTAWANNEAF